MTLRRLFGAVVLLALVGGALALAIQPGVRARAARVAGLMARDAFADAVADPFHPLDLVGGIRPGDPVYLEQRPDGLRPVAYVTAVTPKGVHVRAVPGETLPPDRVLARVGPPYGLTDAWRTAVSRETEARLIALFTRTVRELLDASILPEVRRRLPAFVERVDPRRDARAKAVLDGVGGAVIERLRPLGEDLARQVASDVKARFDFLERVGLLWDVLKGDAEALRRQVTPVAEESARTWWTTNREAVLTAVGEGVAERAGDLQTWVVDDVWPAARDEIVAPVLETQGPAMERAGEMLVRQVAAAVVEVPEGGFRLGFRTVLRTRLLEKDEPLLLFRERAP